MQIIIDQEKSLHDFTQRKDGKTTADLLHRDFIEIWYSWKTHTYDTTMNALKKEEEKPNYKIHAQDFYITDCTDDLVHILYKTANINTDWYVHRYAKRSSIWVLENDSWKMKYHQATPSREFEIQT